MFSFIKKLFLFLFAAGVIYLIFIVVVGLLNSPYLTSNLNYRIGSPGFMYSRMQEVKKINNVDVLFLGSSHAYRGFDPRIYQKSGMTSFNLGSSGQTPVQTECLLRKYLETLNPSLIIWEVYPGILGNDGVESSVDLIANDKIDSDMLRMAFRINHVKTYNTLIYGMFRQLFGLNKNFREPCQKGDEQYIPGGYVEKNLTYNQNLIIKDKSDWVLNNLQLSTLNNTIAFLKSRKYPYILVQLPISSVLYDSYSNNHEIDRMLYNLGPYYNLNNLISLSDSLDFYDLDHLNQNGVEKVNKELVQIVKTEALKGNWKVKRDDRDDRDGRDGRDDF